MSKKVQRAKAKLEAERCEIEVDERTPEEKAESEKRAREALNMLTVATAFISSMPGGNCYTEMLFKK